MQCEMSVEPSRVWVLQKNPVCGELGLVLSDVGGDLSMLEIVSLCLAAGHSGIRGCGG